MEFYCDFCNKEIQHPIIAHIPRVIVINKESFNVMEDVAYCPICNLPIDTPAYEEAALKHAYELYRRKHHMLQPSDIKYYRKKYYLPQWAASALLGLKDMGRFERGTLQNKATEATLDILKNPAQLLKRMCKADDVHAKFIQNGEKQRWDKIIQKLKKLEQQEERKVFL